MSSHRNSTFVSAVLCILLPPALASAQVPALAGAQGAAPPSTGTFPGFIALGGSPEGLAVDKTGNVFVSVDVGNPLDPYVGSDQIWKFSRSGEKSVIADFGVPHGGRCGLALDVQGNLYMARNSAPPAPPGYTGVYQVNGNGNISLVPGTDQMTFPDALAFDQRGTLYVTDTFSIDPATGAFGQGGIWRIRRGGAAQLWLRHDLLTGLTPTLFPFPVGANGIAFYLGSLYVINTDKCLVARVPILPDGSPGQPEVWAQVQDVPESFLYQSPYFPLMLEGIALDVCGNAYVTVISRNAVVRIDAKDRSQNTIAVNNPGPPGPLTALLDAPVNPVFGTGMAERQTLFLTNMGVYGIMVQIPGWTWPGPGLVKIEVEIPGVPLP